MLKKSLPALALSLLLGTQASAGQYSFHQKVFPRQIGAACQLTRLTMEINKFLIHLESGPSYFTSMATVIETNKTECVKNYAVVQWIRGCLMSQTFKKSTGELGERSFSDRDLRGNESVPFASADWIVDTTDVDPMYQSNSSGHGDRMDWYYAAKNPLKLKNDAASLASDDSVYEHANKRYFLQDPAVVAPKQIFVTDMPDMANYHQEAQFDVGLVSTPSLEFQTCVYETKDIPFTGDPMKPGTPQALGGPIQCYAWDHKFNFNPVTRDFERVTTPGVDAFCLTPPPTDN
jgi:hypothetical protein